MSFAASDQAMAWCEAERANSSPRSTRLAAGRYDTAFGYLHRALELCAERENPHGTATVLFSLGRGQCLAGQPDRARHSLVRALALFTELGAPQAADVRAHLERVAGHRPAQGPVRSG